VKVVFCTGILGYQMHFYQMKNAEYLFRVMLNDQPVQLVFTSRIIDDLKETVHQDKRKKN